MNFKLPNAEQVSTDLLIQTKQVVPPVDLSKITSLWSELEICYDELKDEGYLLDLGAFGKEIVIRSSTPVSRQRFTIAHEIGHLILQEHKIRLAKDVFFHSKEARNSFIEQWCNEFAASLLMPKEWILRDIRQGKVRGLVQSILKLPNSYQVSNTAFRKRVSEITPLSIFDIKQTDRNLLVERIIEKRYESKIVKRFYIEKTLEELLPKLEDSAETVKHFHKKTQMFSVYNLISDSIEKYKWTVCVYPQSHKINTSKP